MSYEESPTPIKMFFPQSEIKKTVLGKDDASLSYIIFQNNELHTKYMEMKDMVQEFEHDKDEHDMEIDSLTKTRTCLQGYVKNEYELAQNWKILATKFEDIYKAILSSFKMTMLLNMAMYMVIVSIYNLHIRIVLNMLYGTIQIVYMRKKLKEFKNMYDNEDLTKIKDDIKRIDKSNIYIQELVDNI